MIYSNSVSISCHFFDTTPYTVYVTDYRASNLEKSFVFEKQLRLKTIDTVAEDSSCLLTYVLRIVLIGHSEYDYNIENVRGSTTE